jgi:hypothetical protein
MQYHENWRKAYILPCDYRFALNDTRDFNERRKGFKKAGMRWSQKSDIYSSGNVLKDR